MGSFVCECDAFVEGYPLALMASVCISATPLVAIVAGESGILYSLVGCRAKVAPNVIRVLVPACYGFMC